MPFFILVLFFCLGSTALEAQAPYAIGVRNITYTDASRNNRSVEFELYYPAQLAGNNTAAVADSFPLLIFGHGFVMSWSVYEPIWEALVPEGYVMAFPRTETGISPSHEAFGRDMVFLHEELRRASADSGSNLFGLINSKTVVMGHSMGGGAAFLAMSYDSSIRALACLAPAETNPSAIAAARLHNAPTLIIAGQGDCVTPPVDHQIPMYDSSASPCKAYISLDRGGHCAFAASSFTCNTGEFTCSPSNLLSRQEQQSRTALLLKAWLALHIQEAPNALQNWDAALNDNSSFWAETREERACFLPSTQHLQDLSQGYKLYPNPSSGSFWLELADASEPISLQLYSPLGQLLWTKAYQGQSQVEIQRGDYPTGLYILEIQSSKGRETLRLQFID